MAAGSTTRGPGSAPLRAFSVGGAVAYGSYVDEPLLMRAAGNRYYYASNRLYSVAAIISQAGQVVERYKYDAYGKQAILAENGVVAYKPSDYGQFHGFTGRYHDWETSLSFMRNRIFDHNLGRFISRDPVGATDGNGLYNAYFIPNGQDPFGLWNESGHFYTVYYVARAAGYVHSDAIRFAQFAQYTDENTNYDAIKGLTNERRKEIQRRLHSLTGGDPGRYRERIKCLIRNENLTKDEIGILLHALGDTYAHSYASWSYGIDGDRRIIIEGADAAYTYPFGHALSGHGPDYIANNRARYSDYVYDMYQLFREINPSSQGNLNFIFDLQTEVHGVPYQSVGLERQNAQEILFLNRFSESRGYRYEGTYRPELATPGPYPVSDEGWSEWGEDGNGKMDTLLRKITEPKKCCGQ